VSAVNERRIVSVTELNSIISSVIDSEPLLAELCVRGELSNYKIYPSGHHYFTLKDQESSIRCVMFKGSASKLRFNPENGMSVSCFGSIRVFPRDGAYQLYCTGIIPEGAGDLQVAFDQLKAKLSEEGLFDRAHKKPLPKFPDRIAIITSSAGAAVHDMIRILGARWPLSTVVLLPVRVQGTEAPAEIAGAIRYSNEFNVADVIITGRGGGSIEDLWAFNDERVARAIYASEIPVISAVGHEPDVTISDYVADMRASTPSNAAEIAVPDRNDIIEYLENLEIRSSVTLRKRIGNLKERLSSVQQRRVISNPETYFENCSMLLDRCRDRIISAGERVISAKKQQLYSLSAGADAMSPLKVLSRGYAIAESNDGSIIRTVSQLKDNDSISLRLSDGRVDCSVKKVSPFVTGENNEQQNI